MSSFLYMCTCVMPRTWNSISGLDSWLDFRFKVSCAVAVKVRSRKYFFQVIYHTPYWRSSSIKGRLPSKVVFHQSSSSINGCMPSKVVFYQRCLPSKVVFHPRSSSIKGCLPSKVVFCPQTAPELPPKWIKQNELGRLDKESLEKKDRNPNIQKLTCRSSANFVSAGQKPE